MTDNRFRDTQFPTTVGIDASGGPLFKTTVMELGSGYEKANLDWRYAKVKYEISRPPAKKSDFDLLRNFYWVMQGRGYAFRFKDHADFRVGSASTTQSIGTTDGVTAAFQVYKRYSSGGYTYDRPLQCIVASSYRVYHDGALKTEGAGSSQYQIDKRLGIVTLGSTLAATTGKDVAIACEFDVPVRFDTDWANFSAHFRDLEADESGNATGVIASWESIPLVFYRIRD